MASRTPDWNALASENERFLADGGASAERLLARGVTISWWGNVRFEKTFTPALAALLARSGCIAVSGGLEVASDRLLKLMNKGVTSSSDHNTRRLVPRHDDRPPRHGGAVDGVQVAVAKAGAHSADQHLARRRLVDGQVDDVERARRLQYRGPHGASLPY